MRVLKMAAPLTGLVSLAEYIHRSPNGVWSGRWRWNYGDGV